MDDLASVLNTLLLVGVVAALAPLIVALLPGPRVPQIVLLIIGGIVIGPQGSRSGRSGGLDLIANIGLGLRVPAGRLRARPGRVPRAGRAARADRLGDHAALAAGLVGVLAAVGFVHAFVPVALALTTTALGTLLPILRENDLLAGRSAATSSPPARSASCCRSSASRSSSAPEPVRRRSCRSPRSACSPSSSPSRPASRAAAESSGSSRRASTPPSQTTLRFTIVLLLFLLAVAATFGLDVVLGAFLAGMVLRRWAPGDAHALEEKLDAVGYGFFIPVFFVVSGMTLDVDSIVEAPLRLLVFFVLLLVIRGLPALFVYRRALPMTQRLQMMFITATALPLLVALAEIGLRNGTMLPENAAALVGAGVLSVIVYPAIAVAIGARSGPPRAHLRTPGEPTSTSRPASPPPAREPAHRPTRVTRRATSSAPATGPDRVSERQP